MDQSPEVSSDVILVPVTDDGDLKTEEVEINSLQNNSVVPGRSKAAATVCLEPGCNFRCSRIPGLREHLLIVHGLSNPKQTLRFNSEVEFLEWLSKIEDENHCTYMRRRGWQKNKNESKTCCYYCHRGGLYVSAASKKQSKQQGSCKTGVECTSSLKVTSWPRYDNLIEVEAYLEHYGHNFELGHTRIHWRNRKEIETKLKSGMSRHKILDEIRGSLDQTSDLSRVHLISLQDIYNIEKKCGIRASRGRYCSEAGITAQAWIEGMQQSEDSPVLLIKYQQEAASEKHSCLSEDDFLLVLQTPLQAKMLQKHGPRQCMCIDFTQGHSTTEDMTVKESHAFKLFAVEVLIPDENHNKEPYPVARCVSNRKDEEILRIFFECVKENLHGFTLTPGYLFIPSSGISGGQDWFHIWCMTFGAGPRKLISSWHVLDEWKSTLQHKCPSTFASMSERSRVLTNLETVIRETSGDHFVKLIEECLTDLKTNSMTESFATYFESNYMSQAELWSSAYRTDAANSADMYLDIFHTRLSKHIYHEALKRKQLDILVKTLMKYTRDHVLMKLRNIHKGKSEFHQRALTSSLHKQSFPLSLDDVSPIEDKDNEWNVLSIVHSIDEHNSQLQKVAVRYTVKIRTKHCCTARLRCPMRCSDCAACSHQMTCSCIGGENAEDSKMIDKHMCIHAHLVCRYLKEKLDRNIDDFINPPLLVRSQDGDIKYTSAQNTVKQESGVVTDVIVTLDMDDVSFGDEIPESGNTVIDDLQQNQLKSVVNEQAQCLGSASTKLLTLSVLRDRDESIRKSESNKPKKVIKLEGKSGVYIVPSKFNAKILEK